MITLSPTGDEINATAGGGTTTSSTAVVLSAANLNIAAGQAVFDLTTDEPVGTVASVSGTSVTLAANASHAITTGDALLFSPSGDTGNTVSLGDTLAETLESRELHQRLD